MSLFYASCLLVGIAYWYIRYPTIRYSDVYKEIELEEELTEIPKPFNLENVDPPTAFLDEILKPGPWLTDLLEHPYISYRYLRNGIECMIVKTTGLAWGGYVRSSYIGSFSDIHEGMNISDYDGWVGFSCNQPEDLSPFPFVDETRRFWTFLEVLEKTNRMADLISSSTLSQETPLSSS